MNKVMLGLILTVCLLGMLLVMLNERLGRKSDSGQSGPAIAETVAPAPPAQSGAAPQPAGARPQLNEAQQQQMAQAIVREESEEARAALAPPALSQEPARIAAQTAPEARQPDVQAAPPASLRLPETAPAVVPPAPKPAVEQAARPVEPPAPAPAAAPAQTPRPAPQAKPAETRKPEAAAPRAADNTIARFVIYSRDKGATVRMGANRPIKYSSMTLENPDRVVVDLDGHWDFPPNPGIPRNDLVSNVRIGKNGDKTRVVIDLKSKPRVSRVVTSGDGSTVDVRVDR